MEYDIIGYFEQYTAKIKKLERQHWKECWQIALYQEELRMYKEPFDRAITLLKLVMDEASSFKKCQSCTYDGNYTKECMGCYGDKWKWRYHEECEKLVNEIQEQRGLICQTLNR